MIFRVISCMLPFRLVDEGRTEQVRETVVGGKAGYSEEASGES